MNYEKKYKEALERAKDNYNAADSANINVNSFKNTLIHIFPELKESEDERIRKALRKRIIRYDPNNEILIKEEGISQKQFLAWLEKQGEQKSVDKIEPKFKIGDWIVYNRTDHSREVMQIYDIRDNRYYFNDNAHFSWSVKECGEKSHLWTIEDAEKGDVLAASDDSVFIFARVDGHSCIFHIALANDGRLAINPLLISAWGNVKGVKPATKEQCDKLEKAMLKAGYKWDADKKELIKL